MLYELQCAWYSEKCVIYICIYVTSLFASFLYRIDDKAFNSECSVPPKYCELSDDVQFANCPDAEITFGYSGCSFGLEYNVSCLSWFSLTKEFSQSTTFSQHIFLIQHINSHLVWYDSVGETYFPIIRPKKRILLLIRYYQSVILKDAYIVSKYSVTQKFSST